MKDDSDVFRDALQIRVRLTQRDGRYRKAGADSPQDIMNYHRNDIKKRIAAYHAQQQKAKWSQGAPPTPGAGPSGPPSQNAVRPSAITSSTTSNGNFERPAGSQHGHKRRHHLPRLQRRATSLLCRPALSPRRSSRHWDGTHHTSNKPGPPRYRLSRCRCTGRCSQTMPTGNESPTPRRLASHHH